MAEIVDGRSSESVTTATLIKVWPLLDPFIWNTQHGPRDRGAVMDSSDAGQINSHQDRESDDAMSHEDTRKGTSSLLEVVNEVPSSDRHGHSGGFILSARFETPVASAKLGRAASRAEVQQYNEHSLIKAADACAAIPTKSTVGGQFTSISFALDPLLRWAWLEPIMQYRFAGVRPWSVWFVSASMVWLIAVAILRQSHPLLLVMVMGVWFTTGSGAGMRIDRRLMTVLFRHFEFWYLVFHLGVMSISAIYATADTESVVFQITYWSGLTVLSLYALVMDTYAALSHVSRFCCVVTGLGMYANMLIRENIHREMEPVPVCLVFCTDTRRLSLLGLMQLFYFFGRYTWTAMKAVRGQPQFAVLRAPMRCSLVAAPCSSSTSTLENAKLTNGHSPAAVVSSTEALPLVRVETELSPQSFGFELLPSVAPATMDYMGTSSSLLSAPQRAETVPPRQLLANQQLPLVRPYVHHREFPFRPVIPWVFLQRLTRHRLYQALVAGFLISYAAINGLARMRTATPTWLLFAGALIVVFCESSRFDRTIVAAVLRRFEFYIVILSGLQFAVFGLISESFYYGVEVLFPPFASLFLFHIMITLMDAAPSYPRVFRLLCVAVYILNAFRLFITAQLRDVYYPYKVCVFFCSTTSVLALSGLFTAVVFSIKYFVNLVRDGSHCTILTTKIAFTAQKDVPIMIPADTASAPSDGRNGTDMNPTGSTPSVVVETPGASGVLPMADRRRSSIPTHVVYMRESGHLIPAAVDQRSRGLSIGIAAYAVPEATPVTRSDALSVAQRRVSGIRGSVLGFLPLPAELHRKVNITTSADVALDPLPRRADAAARLMKQGPESVTRTEVEPPDRLQAERFLEEHSASRLDDHDVSVSRARAVPTVSQSSQIGATASGK